MKRSTAIVFLLVGCFLWSCIGIASRALYAAGFTPLQVSATKSGVTALALGLFLLIFDRSKLSVKKKDVWIIAALGITKFICDTLIFYGQAHISLSLTSMLLVTYPYYVLIFSAILFKEKITQWKVMCMIIAALGCILATGVLTEDGPFDALGIIAAACAGVMAGLNSIASKVCLNRGYSPETVLFYLFFAGAVISLFIADPIQMVTIAMNENSVIGYALLLGLFLTLFPHLLNLKAMKWMSVTYVCLIGLSEIVFTSLVGYFVFNENLSASNLIGMVLIISSIVLMELKAKNESAEN